MEKKADLVSSGHGAIVERILRSEGDFIMEAEERKGEGEREN